jgi:hypothetical protein
MEIVNIYVIYPINATIIALVLEDKVYSLEKKYYIHISFLKKYGYSISDDKYLEAYINIKNLLEYLL